VNLDLIELLDVSVGGSPPEIGSKLSDRLNRAFGDRFYGPIGKITNNSSNTRVSSCAKREIAKPNPLNSASDNKSPGYGH
jgi:hypothetical protein